MAVTGHPEHSSPFAVLLEHDVESALYVHVLVRRPLLHRDRQLVHGPPEMLGED
jgi:hypothetical protein